MEVSYKKTIGVEYTLNKPRAQKNKTLKNKRETKNTSNHDFYMSEHPPEIDKHYFGELSESNRPGKKFMKESLDHLKSDVTVKYIHKKLKKPKHSDLELQDDLFFSGENRFYTKQQEPQKPGTLIKREDFESTTIPLKKNCLELTVNRSNCPMIVRIHKGCKDDSLQTPRSLKKTQDPSCFDDIDNQPHKNYYIPRTTGEETDRIHKPIQNKKRKKRNISYLKDNNSDSEIEEKLVYAQPDTESETYESTVNDSYNPLKRLKQTSSKITSRTVQSKRVEPVELFGENTEEYYTNAKNIPIINPSYENCKKPSVLMKSMRLDDKLTIDENLPVKPSQFMNFRKTVTSNREEFVKHATKKTRKTIHYGNNSTKTDELSYEDEQLKIHKEESKMLYRPVPTHKIRNKHFADYRDISVPIDSHLKERATRERSSSNEVREILRPESERALHSLNYAEVPKQTEVILKKEKQYTNSKYINKKSIRIETNKNIIQKTRVNVKKDSWPKDLVILNASHSQFKKISGFLHHESSDEDKPIHSDSNKKLFQQNERNIYKTQSRAPHRNKIATENYIFDRHPTTATEMQVRHKAKEGKNKLLNKNQGIYTPNSDISASSQEELLEVTSLSGPPHSQNVLVRKDFSTKHLNNYNNDITGTQQFIDETPLSNKSKEDHTEKSEMAQQKFYDKTPESLHYEENVLTPSHNWDHDIGTSQKSSPKDLNLISSIVDKKPTSASLRHLEYKNNILPTLGNETQPKKEYSRDETDSNIIKEYTNNSELILKSQEMASTGNEKDSKQSKLASTGNDRDSKQSKLASTSNVRDSKQSKLASTGNVKDSKQSKLASTVNEKDSKQSKLASTGNDRDSKQSKLASTGNVRDSKQSKLASTGNVKDSKQSKLAITVNEKDSKQSKFASTGNNKDSKLSKLTSTVIDKDSKQSKLASTDKNDDSAYAYLSDFPLPKYISVSKIKLGSESIKKTLLDIPIMSESKMRETSQAQYLGNIENSVPAQLQSSLLDFNIPPFPQLNNSENRTKNLKLNHFSLGSADAVKRHNCCLSFIDSEPSLGEIGMEKGPSRKEEVMKTVPSNVENMSSEEGSFIKSICYTYEDSLSKSLNETEQDVLKNRSYIPENKISEEKESPYMLLPSKNIKTSDSVKDIKSKSDDRQKGFMKQILSFSKDLSNKTKLNVQIEPNIPEQDISEVKKSPYKLFSGEKPKTSHSGEDIKSKSEIQQKSFINSARESDYLIKKIGSPQVGYKPSIPEKEISEVKESPYMLFPDEKTKFTQPSKDSKSKSEVAQTSFPKPPSDSKYAMNKIDLSEHSVPKIRSSIPEENISQVQDLPYKLFQFEKPQSTYSVQDSKPKSEAPQKSLTKPQSDPKYFLNETDSPKVSAKEKMSEIKKSPYMLFPGEKPKSSHSEKDKISKSEAPQISLMKLPSDSKYMLNKVDLSKQNVPKIIFTIPEEKISEVKESLYNLFPDEKTKSTHSVKDNKSKSEALQKSYIKIPSDSKYLTNKTDLSEQNVPKMKSSILQNKTPELKESPYNLFPGEKNKSTYSVKDNKSTSEAPQKSFIKAPNDSKYLLKETDFPKMKSSILQNKTPELKESPYNLFPGQKNKSTYPEKDTKSKSEVPQKSFIKPPSDSKYSMNKTDSSKQNFPKTRSSILKDEMSKIIEFLPNENPEFTDVIKDKISSDIHQESIVKTTNVSSKSMLEEPELNVTKNKSELSEEKTLGAKEPSCTPVSSKTPKLANSQNDNKTRLENPMSSGLQFSENFGKLPSQSIKTSKNNSQAKDDSCERVSDLAVKKSILLDKAKEGSKQNSLIKENLHFGEVTSMQSFSDQILFNISVLNDKKNTIPSSTLNNKNNELYQTSLILRPGKFESAKTVDVGKKEDKEINVPENKVNNTEIQSLEIMDGNVSLNLSNKGDSGKKDIENGQELLSAKQHYSGGNIIKPPETTDRKQPQSHDIPSSNPSNITESTHPQSNDIPLNKPVDPTESTDNKLNKKKTNISDDKTSEEGNKSTQTKKKGITPKSKQSKFKQLNKQFYCNYITHIHNFLGSWRVKNRKKTQTIPENPPAPCLDLTSENILEGIGLIRDKQMLRQNFTIPRDDSLLVKEFGFERVMKILNKDCSECKGDTQWNFSEKEYGDLKHDLLTTEDKCTESLRLFARGYYLGSCLSMRSSTSVNLSQISQPCFIASLKEPNFVPFNETSIMDSLEINHPIEIKGLQPTNYSQLEKGPINNIKTPNVRCEEGMLKENVSLPILNDNEETFGIGQQGYFENGLKNIFKRIFNKVINRKHKTKTGEMMILKKLKAN